MSRTITALFDNRADAEAARGRLTSANIDLGDARIIDQSSPGYSADRYSSDQDRGFWSSLKHMFLPEEDRHTFEEGVRRGSYLLVVDVTDPAADADRVVHIIDECNPVDIDQRTQEWRASGWSSPAMTATTGMTDTTRTTATTAATGMGADMARTSEEHIPIVEEELRIGKREVDRGGVRVRSYIVETPVHEQVELREEHVSVERRPVDQPAAGMDDLMRERTIEMTETAEEAVVAKEARIREEVVVRKDVEERTQQIDDTVRHTEIEIDDQRGTDRLAASDGRMNKERIKQKPTGGTLG